LYTSNATRTDVLLNSGFSGWRLTVSNLRHCVTSRICNTSGYSAVVYGGSLGCIGERWDKWGVENVSVLEEVCNLFCVLNKNVRFEVLLAVTACYCLPVCDALWLHGVTYRIECYRHYEVHAVLFFMPACDEFSHVIVRCYSEFYWHGVLDKTRASLAKDSARIRSFVSELISSVIR